MTLLLIANISMVLGALTGQWLVTQYNKWGFVVYVGVEMAMIYIGMQSKNYGLVIAAILYFCMNVYSFVKWSRKHHEL